MTPPHTPVSAVPSTAPVKLTKAQQAVLDLLKGDWELGFVGTFVSETRVWVQPYGGGSSRRIAKTIFDALLKQGLIALHAEKYPVKKYRLAAKVQTAAPAA